MGGRETWFGGRSGRETWFGVYLVLLPCVCQLCDATHTFTPLHCFSLYQRSFYRSLSLANLSSGTHPIRTNTTLISTSTWLDKVLIWRSTAFIQRPKCISIPHFPVRSTIKLWFSDIYLSFKFSFLYHNAIYVAISPCMCMDYNRSLITNIVVVHIYDGWVT